MVSSAFCSQACAPLSSGKTSFSAACSVGFRGGTFHAPPKLKVPPPLRALHALVNCLKTSQIDRSRVGTCPRLNPCCPDTEYFTVKKLRKWLINAATRTAGVPHTVKGGSRFRRGGVPGGGEGPRKKLCHCLSSTSTRSAVVLTLRGGCPLTASIRGW